MINFLFIFIVDVPNYCKANPTEVLPDPDNCAHYYNCSIAMATTYRGGAPVVVSQKQMECPYPDLYDPVLKTCANFTSVNCKTRKEPQAPCKLMIGGKQLLLRFCLITSNNSSSILPFSLDSCLML